MHQTPNKKMVGLFFLIGIITFLVIIGGSFVSRIWERDTYMAVMYFEESTQGLRVGSPVVLNGVEIGKVVKIAIEVDPQDFKFKIPIYVQLSPISKVENRDWILPFSRRPETLSRLIQSGLRASLITQSYLTGQLMIEFSIDKDAPLHFEIPPAEQDPDIPEIPTVLSASGKLSKGLKDLQFQDSFEHLNKILESLNKQLPSLLNNLTQTSKNIEKITSAISADTVDRTNTALTDISAAMRSLRNLTDYLEQYPESLVKGKK